MSPETSNLNLHSRSLVPAGKAGNDHIIFAGAGVSAGPPSALPGWWLLNEWIMLRLRDRLHSALKWSDSKVTSWIEEALARREQELFPPEYQAQIIEEMCGIRYFRSLQALDVTVVNTAHRAIASTAAEGHLRAIVTTNFDRLIERALEEIHIPYLAVFDEEGYAQLAQRMQSGDDLPLVVLKIHGCVREPSSMIDTLKQRLRGRSASLENCLDGFGRAHWLYLGFSAEDLTGNPDYLGMRRRAADSPGGTYLSYPLTQETPRGRQAACDSMGKGARILMQAHGSNGELWVDEIANFLTQRFGWNPQAPEPDRLPPVASGRAESERKLAAWAESLSPAAAGLCLAAILEAVGNAEGAARLLDKLVRKEFVFQADRASDDYRAVQLHYGRLGAAWGRFLGVPDLNGAESNASVETAQSLMRLEPSKLRFPAKTWLLCHQLWRGNGREAMLLASGKIDGMINGFPLDDAPRHDEDILDAWTAIAQAFLINEGPITLQYVRNTTPDMRSMAQTCGDAIRAARIAALGMLASCRSEQIVWDEFKSNDPVFDQAERVCDGFALGMRYLALGRWLVGPGGISLSKTLGQAYIAQGALRYLVEAVKWFDQQGMDPWVLYATIQIIKACADLQDFETAQMHSDNAANLLGRFPIFTAHLREAQSQVFGMLGAPQSVHALENAIESARIHGLPQYQEFLRSTLRQTKLASEST